MTEQAAEYKTEPKETGAKALPSAKEILAKHGPAGGLVLSLERYARLGWILFIVTLALFMIYIFVGRIVGSPVLAVDESGRVLGSFEYVGADYRTNDEYVKGVARFSSYYLSFNSATIYNDMALALSAMYDAPDTEDDARGQYLARLKTTNLPNTIAKSDSRSYLERDAGYPRVVDGPDADGLVTVQDKGTIRMIVAGTKRPQAYNIFVKVRAVRRSTVYALGTLGIQIIDVWEG